MTATSTRPAPASQQTPTRSYRDLLARTTARSIGRRRIKSITMIVITYLCAFLATAPLIVILWYLLEAGASSVNWRFFTMSTSPPGSPGGMANAIAGSGILVLIACALGLPVGIGAGLYLADQGTSKLATAVRFLSDVLNGLPSIVLGIFAWQLLVKPFHHFSALSGGIALAAMMIPLVTRATEEMIRLVPVSLREAALALGYARWRTALTVVLRTALPGIVTGALVAVARIAGETAPLIFTAFGNNFWSLSPFKPIAALPMSVFNYAISPYDDWNAKAWAGSLVLIGLVLVISLGAKYVTRSRFGVGGD